jgi:hypothetical protein
MQIMEKEKLEDGGWVDFNGKLTAIILESNVTGTEYVFRKEDVRFVEGKLYVKGSKIFNN